jgi:1,4-alpha-glucan branching enzyme
MKTSSEQAKRLISSDPLLEPYESVIQRRLTKIQEKEAILTGGEMPLLDFASGHEFYGLHFHGNEWVFREWAPNATAIFMIGDMTKWNEERAFALERVNSAGTWAIRLPPGALSHGDLYRLRIHWKKGAGDRIPAFARRVVQDPDTLIFNAQVWRPVKAYQWKCPKPTFPNDPLFIYEAHVGMAQQEEKIGTYREFIENVLQRIIAGGYNTIQLMAIQEHPYYGSFGYQVSSFFAASSRYGPPEDLKELIDAAHQAGIRMIMDLVHSHGVSNEVEGLSRFDGTTYQYFHDGPRGRHLAWNSRCFDYGKPEVLHFLLSNCRFWLDEYRFDGFRLDGVTSMLYHHHGLGKAFTSYNDYFDGSVDEDAYAYLALANRVIHDVRPDAVTIAEDVSGMPGLAVSKEMGGIGFDYRFAMGIPDNWTRLAKDMRDEDWPMGNLWFELTNRRRDERTISYAESHDQALVGDQTLIFRLIGNSMYDHMQVTDENLIVDRGISLHKLIRLITLTTADKGYLNFMGNEFGHPEWIDFPREGNCWSFRYARRQWHLADDTSLRYHFLSLFDRDMLSLARNYEILKSGEPLLLVEHNSDNVLAFTRAGLIFAFNFHPTNSYVDYRFEALPGKYKLVLDTDEKEYGGHQRLLKDQHYYTLVDTSASARKHVLSLYLPSRTALVLMKEKEERSEKNE